MSLRTPKQSWAEQDPLSAWSPGAGPFGRAFVHHPRVASTNDLARSAASAGAPEGLLVSADEQTAGRGRLGRRWQAPPGTAVLCSLLLRPALPPALAFRATLLVALAAAQAVERVTSLPVALKWPNDLLVHGRKVAGVLAESSVSGDQLEFVVVGIGINVHWHPSGVAATSLDAAAGTLIPRRAVLGALVGELGRWRPLLAPEPPDRLLAAWRARLVTLGNAVQARGVRARHSGQAVAVTPDGGLVIAGDDGYCEVVYAADVTLRSRA